MESIYEVIQVEGKEITIIQKGSVVIHDAQDFLQMMMNLPSDRIIIPKENFDEKFFELRTGLAGEILQKVINYGRHLVIVGDFSVYESKSLKDFIYESNKSKQIGFLNSTEDAIRKLSI